MYLVPRAFVVPVLLIALALYLGFSANAWAYLAIPFVVLGALCAAPNLNLADGFLVMVSAVIGFLVALKYPDGGYAIAGGAILSWLLSSFERGVRSKRVPD